MANQKARRSRVDAPTAQRDVRGDAEVRYI